MNIKNFFVAAGILVVFAVGVVVGIVGFRSQSLGDSGVVINLVHNFTGGLNAGKTNQFRVDTSGNVSSSAIFAAATSTVGNLVAGNGVLSLSLVSSTAATSITAAQFCGNGVATVTNNGSQTTSTLTFPVATSTFATCMTNLGSRKFLDIYNTSSSSHIVTIASSTGVTMVKPFNVSSTFTVTGGGAVRLELRQITSSTALLYVEQMQ